MEPVLAGTDLISDIAQLSAVFRSVLRFGNERSRGRAIRQRSVTPHSVYSGDADFPPSVPVPFPLPAPQTDGATTTPFTRSLQ